MCRPGGSTQLDDLHQVCPQRAGAESGGGAGREQHLLQGRGGERVCVCLCVCVCVCVRACVRARACVRVRVCVCCGVSCSSSVAQALPWWFICGGPRKHIQIGR